MWRYVHDYKLVHYTWQKIAIVNARVLILMINSPANLNFQLNCQSPDIHKISIIHEYADIM